MKKIFPFLLLSLSFNLQAQEICDNGIDDDADGWIDLNDDECVCDGISTALNIIPNPSFEEMTCCPSGFGDLICADNWVPASEASPDYFNFCDFSEYPGAPPMLPLPGEPGGEGFAGFISWGDWGGGGPYYNEYIASQELIEPLEAGTEYTMTLWTAWAVGAIELDFTLFGTSDIDDIPWLGYLCPEDGGWELLASQEVTYTIDRAWQEITFTFTPTEEINAIVIGGPCAPGSDELSYYYVDELNLRTSFIDRSLSITQSGHLCQGDLTLTATHDAPGGTWQWYEDGIALIGEVDATLEVEPYGPGNYSVVYSIDGECEVAATFVADAPIIDITVDITPEVDGGDGAIDITVTGGTEPYTFDWDTDGTGDFDDSEDLTDLPEGTYIVEVKDDNGCVGTATIVVSNHLGLESLIKMEIKIFPNPTTNNITIETAGTYNYQLSALNGDIVLEGTATDQELISLESIAAGIYLLRVENERCSEVIKLVKQLLD